MKHGKTVFLLTFLLNAIILNCILLENKKIIIVNDSLPNVEYSSLNNNDSNNNLNRIQEKKLEKIPERKGTITKTLKGKEEEDHAYEKSTSTSSTKKLEETSNSNSESKISKGDEWKTEENPIKAASLLLTTTDLFVNPGLTFTDYLSIDRDLKLLDYQPSDLSNVVLESKIIKNLEKEGWNRFWVKTNSLNARKNDSENSKVDYTDILNNPYVQMYLAGYVEGRLNYKEIINFYSNMVANSTGKSQRSSSWNAMKSFFKQVGDNILKKIETGEKLIDGITQQYSDALSLSVFQLKGLINGFNFQNRINKESDDLAVEDFLIIQADGELSEIARLIQYRKAPKNYRMGSPNYFRKAFGISMDSKDSKFYEKNFNARLNLRNDHCSALIKLIKDEKGNYSDILSGHVTWSDYAEGIKYIKNYNFGYSLPASILEGTKRIEPDNVKFRLHDKEKICSEELTLNKKPANIMFSAYAGTLSSTDDFYISSNKIMVTETTLNVLNLDSYASHRSPNKYIPNFLRVNTATLFSNSARNWMTSMCQYNTGTYSSQWSVLDYKVFDNLKAKKLESSKRNLRSETDEVVTNAKNLVLVMEQIPQSITVKDLSKNILTNSYWASFNKSFFEETNKDLDTEMLEQLYGYGFSYKRSERAIAFNRIENKIKNSKDFKNALMYNGYKQNNTENVFHIIEDPSSNDSASAISARYDLGASSTPFGGTDFKMTSSEMINDLKLIAHHGPTVENNSNLTKFSWTEYEKDNSDIVSHVGVPNELTSFPFLKLSPKDMSYDDGYAVFDFNS